MNIAFVSTLAEGGAAQGMENTYRAFLATGHQATFLALDGGQEKGFIPLSTELPKRREQNHFAALARHWLALTCPEKMRQSASELFSDATIGLFRLGEEARAALRAAEAVNVHWNSGILFSPALLDALKGRKVILTLPDLAPMTGGCHYHLTCRRFEEGCGHCPCLLVSGEDDLSRRTFEIKQDVYGLLRPSVIALSQWLAGEARKSALLSGYRVSNIIYPYDLDLFRPLGHEERLAVRQSLGLSQNALVILAGAQAVNNGRKNIAALIRSLESIRSRHPDRPFELLVYGYGSSPAASFPIRQAGYVDNRNMWRLYGAADLFVHPAVAEALGNTLCESQCCGTPVMSFDVGGCPETYEPGTSGILVTPTSEEALHAALTDVVLNPQQLVPMRRAARKFALARFTAQRHVQSYLDVINSHTDTCRPLSEAPALSSLLQRNYGESLALFSKWANDEYAGRIADLEGVLKSCERILLYYEQRLAGSEKTIKTVTRMVEKLSSAIAKKAEN